MTVVITDTPYPPQGHQITVGPGTLTSVVCVRPIVTNTNNDLPPLTTAMTGRTKMEVTFYDSVNGPTGTPLVSIDTAYGYTPMPLDLPFTKGLYAVQHSPSAIQVTTA